MSTETSVKKPPLENLLILARENSAAILTYGSILGGAITIGISLEKVQKIEAVTAQRVQNIEAVTSEKVKASEESYSKTAALADEKIKRIEAVSNEKVKAAEDSYAKSAALADEKLKRIESITDEKIRAAEEKGKRETLEIFFNIVSQDQYKRAKEILFARSIRNGKDEKPS